MKKGLLILFILIAVDSGILGSEPSGLRIYLPREVQIDGDVIELGKIGILQGVSGQVSKAQSLSLGQFSIPGQQIELDRITILSRLAGMGIHPENVTLSGAKTIRVYRDEPRISGQQIAEAAKEFLKQHLEAERLVLAEPIRLPKDFMGNPETAKITALMAPNRIAGKRSVFVVIQSDDKNHRIQVDFQVRFQAQRAVAIGSIEAGRKIRSDQIRIEEFHAKEPQNADWKGPEGLVCRQRIADGAVLRPELLEAETPPVMIEKRQKVILKIERGPLVITAFGEAMDEGAIGDVIRVKHGLRPNERILVGTIRPDGTVKPLM